MPETRSIEMALKRDALDAAFSDAIRWACDWKCQWVSRNDAGELIQCGMNWPECKGRDAHCSHFKSRGYSSVRWFPDNATLLCAAHHDYAGKNPDEHYEFFRGHLGAVRYDELIRRYRRIYRYRKHDKAEMRAHFEAEVQRIKGLREKGVIGVVELVPWD